jgi:hypothetical protein
MGASGSTRGKRSPAGGAAGSRLPGQRTRGQCAAAPHRPPGSPPSVHVEGAGPPLHLHPRSGGDGVVAGEVSPPGGQQVGAGRGLAGERIAHQRPGVARGVDVDISRCWRALSAKIECDGYFPRFSEHEGEMRAQDVGRERGSERCPGTPRAVRARLDRAASNKHVRDWPESAGRRGSPRADPVDGMRPHRR